ncbi:hypothetical protein PR202_gb07736 [Eleusine coracana subsp. coracana]|uniref:Photolyase/cryptochrome alpha/beta domain-containing protein n=1 Tax=Eleusine coracana subsp. coracana TaxID=191504 RepID=A0AAV5ECV9_ELECO|nr:hypothetical protein PR202_gb07736 [Eleusine coracana subsp. coracana]
MPPSANEDFTWVYPPSLPSSSAVKPVRLPVHHSVVPQLGSSRKRVRTAESPELLSASQKRSNEDSEPEAFLPLPRDWEVYGDADAPHRALVGGNFPVDRELDPLFEGCIGVGSGHRKPDLLTPVAKIIHLALRKTLLPRIGNVEAITSLQQWLLLSIIQGRSFDIVDSLILSGTTSLAKTRSIDQTPRTPKTWEARKRALSSPASPPSGAPPRWRRPPRTQPRRARARLRSTRPACGCSTRAEAGRRPARWCTGCCGTSGSRTTGRSSTRPASPRPPFRLPRSPSPSLCSHVPSSSARRRQLGFLLRGLRRLAVDARARGLPFFFLEGGPTEVPALVRRLGASALIADFSPLRPVRESLDAVVCELRRDAPAVAVHQVDAHNVVPVWAASGKLEYSAKTLRGKVNKVIDKYLVEYPEMPSTAQWNVEHPEDVDWEALIDRVFSREQLENAKTSDHEVTYTSTLPAAASIPSKRTPHPAQQHRQLRMDSVSAGLKPSALDLLAALLTRREDLEGGVRWSVLVENRHLLVLLTTSLAVLVGCGVAMLVRHAPRGPGAVVAAQIREKEGRGGP